MLGLLAAGLQACTMEPAPEGVGRQALGEPRDGFPSWAERVMHVWANRARCEPAADLAACTVCGDAACYDPVPPLVWSHGLARGARFHSANLALSGCAIQHDSPCDLVSTIGTDYRPGPCNGAPSRACEPGSLSCGSAVTDAFDRMDYFSNSGRAENVARGDVDPVDLHYLFLYERDLSTACGMRAENGHRYNILTGRNTEIGVGKYSTTYTQDFGDEGNPSGVVAGVHYPRTGSDISFRANWYHSAAAVEAVVNLDGSCRAMSLERGTRRNGTYRKRVTGLSSSCHRYYFEFSNGSRRFTYPTTGALGVGCANSWVSSRADPCVCVADCDGRACGDDGCGGSCGSCPTRRRCTAAGDCVCRDAYTECGGRCVDTDVSEAHCGRCGNSCAAGEVCLDGSCECVPDCDGRVCGDDGCGGSCGSCPSRRRCTAAGDCVCRDGYTECGGSCVDTDVSEAHCGSCGVQCLPDQRCVGGVCEGGEPDGGPSDGGPSDGGPSDGGPSDGGPSDGGPSDGGQPDSSPSDGGPSDGSLSDGGPSDVLPGISGGCPSCAAGARPAAVSAPPGLVAFGLVALALFVRRLSGGAAKRRRAAASVVRGGSTSTH